MDSRPFELHRPPPYARPVSVLRWWVLPVLVTAAFLALQPLTGSGWAMFPDSYRYAKQAEQILGVPADQAHQDALQAFCATRATQQTWRGSWVPRSDSPEKQDATATECLQRYAGRGDVTTLDPRYQSIFTTRPGYPLLAAPFVAGFGVATGMWLLGFLMAISGGLLCFTVLRLAGLGAVGAAVGQAAYLASPLGWWALQGLGDGLVSICVLGAVAGLLWARRGAGRAGLVTMAGSWLALAVVRFSSLLLVSAALAAACVVLALTGTRARRAWTWGAAAVSVAAAGGTAAAIPLLGLPGAAVTLQDTFTAHFTAPPVADPWRELWQLNLKFWPAWISDVSASLALLLLAVAGAAALWTWCRELFWAALFLFAAGAAQVAAHPLPQEAERLGLLMWMPAVLGVAVAVDVVLRRSRRAMTKVRGDAPGRTKAAATA